MRGRRQRTWVHILASSYHRVVPIGVSPLRKHHRKRQGLLGGSRRFNATGRLRCLSSLVRPARALPTLDAALESAGAAAFAAALNAAHGAAHDATHGPGVCRCQHQLHRRGPSARQPSVRVAVPPLCNRARGQLLLHLPPRGAFHWRVRAHGQRDLRVGRGLRRHSVVPARRQVRGLLDQRRRRI